MEASRQPAIERLQVQLRRLESSAWLAPNRAIPPTRQRWRRRSRRLGSRVSLRARPDTAARWRSGLPGALRRSRSLAELPDERRSRLLELGEPPRELLGSVQLRERGGGRVPVAALEEGQLSRTRLERPLERIHLGEQGGRARLGLPHRHRRPRGRYVDERALLAGTHGAVVARYFEPVPAADSSARRAPYLVVESFHAA